MIADHCERTGEPTSKFRFEVQVGDVASDRSKAKIFSEEHHLKELERRVGYEEDAFSAKRRGTVVPNDYFSGGQVKSGKRGSKPNGGRQALFRKNG